MYFKHTTRPGFLLGLIDFCTAGLFFLLYIPLGVRKSQDPERTMQNYRKCLEKVNSKEMYDLYANSGFFTLVRDDESTIENTMDKLAKHFGL